MGRIVERGPRLGAAGLPDGAPERGGVGPRARVDAARRAGDGGGVHVEGRGEVARGELGRGAEEGEPQRALLGAGGPVDREAERRARARPPPARGGEEGGRGGEVEQAPERGGDVGPGLGLLGLEEQGGVDEDALPVEQVGEVAQLGRALRQPLRGDGDEVHAQRACDGGGDRGLAMAVATVQVDDGRDGRRGEERPPRGGDALRRGLGPGEERRGRRHDAREPAEPLVEVVEAGEQVQHPLVDAQRRAQERLAGRERHQPEAPERRGGGELGPRPAGEEPQRQPERGERDGALGAARRAQGGDAGVELGAGGEEQDALREAREPERARERLERRRRVRRVRARDLRGRRVRLRARGEGREQIVHAADGTDQAAADLFRGRRRSGGGHDTCTVSGASPDLGAGRGCEATPLTVTSTR